MLYKNDKLLIQYIDNTISVNQREDLFNAIIDECDYHKLHTRFLTHYDSEEADPKDNEMLDGESLLEVT